MGSPVYLQRTISRKGKGRWQWVLTFCEECVGRGISATSKKARHDAAEERKRLRPQYALPIQ